MDQAHERRQQEDVVDDKEQERQLHGQEWDREEGAKQPRLDVHDGEAMLGALAFPKEFLRERVDFISDRNEWRRLFSELLGTFFLVLVAAGGGMVNARFGGDVIAPAALVTAPALMVGAIILFMGTVSGAHLNPGVTLAFAMRGDFPWRRVPGYIVAHFAGACLAALLLAGLVGAHGTAGLTLPGPSVRPAVAMLWEMVLTAGLVSVILGTASGAQNVGSMSALAVAGYIALAGLWGAPMSGASMNTARSLGPALVLGNSKAWWAYLVGPILGSVIAVGIAYILRGKGGGFYGKKAAQGGLGWLWSPGPMARGDAELAEGPPHSDHVRAGAYSRTGSSPR
jgi:aquaporin Z